MTWLHLQVTCGNASLPTLCLGCTMPQATEHLSWQSTEAQKLSGQEFITSRSTSLNNNLGEGLQSALSCVTLDTVFWITYFTVSEMFTHFLKGFKSWVLSMTSDFPSWSRFSLCNAPCCQKSKLFLTVFPQQWCSTKPSYQYVSQKSGELD